VAFSLMATRSAPRFVGRFLTTIDLGILQAIGVAQAPVGDSRFGVHQDHGT
jgi:hypothetical protein